MNNVEINLRLEENLCLGELLVNTKALLQLKTKTNLYLTTFFQHVSASFSLCFSLEHTPSLTRVNK